MTSFDFSEIAKECVDMISMGIDDLPENSPLRNCKLTDEQQDRLGWFVRGARYEREQHLKGLRLAIDSQKVIPGFWKRIATDSAVRELQRRAAIWAGVTVLVGLTCYSCGKCDGIAETPTSTEVSR